MLDRLLDLMEQLIEGGALVSDEIGDDYDQAAIALQALTSILNARDVRAKMARWEWITNEKGKRVQRMRPDNPPTPEEAAAGAQRLREMCETRQAPGLRLFAEGSTKLTNEDGSPITSHAQYEAAKRRKGLEEVSGYDVRNDVGVKRASEVDAEIAAMHAESVERAMAHGRATGQIDADRNVVEGSKVIPMPVQERAPVVKQRPQVAAALEAQGDGPAFVDVPKAERAPVDPVETQRMVTRITSGAQERAIAAAYARTGGAIF